MGVDGSNKIRVASNENTNGSLSSSEYTWSPDSRKIAYEILEDIFVVDADGTKTTRLTHDSRPFNEGVRTANYGPNWSGNDSVIFASYVLDGPKPLKASFKEVNIDGTNAKELFEYDPALTGAYVWSNDKRQVTFVSIDNDNPSLLIMDVNGGNKRLLMNTAAAGFSSISDMTWSPDDTQIAFLASQIGKDASVRDIYLLKLNDASIQKLADSKTFGSNPIWSSDGSQIAFTDSVGDDETIAIYVMKINDGLEKKEIMRIFASIVNKPIDWITKQ
jgi:Tol biopolymer transport system component